MSIPIYEATIYGVSMDDEDPDQESTEIPEQKECTTARCSVGS